jgi:nitroreductase
MSPMPTLPLSPDELLTTTRAVRKRLDLERPVPMELIRECLDSAVQAPTGSNAQGWHWIVITDPELRAGIAQIYREVALNYMSKRTPPEETYAGDPDRIAVQERIGDSSMFLIEHMQDVPALLLAVIQTGSPLPAGNQAGLWGSLLPGAWSFMLAARARGLGTAWTTLHLVREAEVAKLLGLPEGVHQGVLTPVAYYTGDTFKPAPRAPLDTVLHVNGW